MNDTSHDIGRPISACLTHPQSGVDKWHILNDLTLAAKAFGLGHRSLAVLKALMTFLPDRHIALDHGPAVVFPSNRTLADRLTGMPESTLRRHLAALVRSGLVSRRDSPNRKRYARRLQGAGGIAFGFDLSPLARAAHEITEHAEAARRQSEHHAILRARLTELCHHLQDSHSALIVDARRALRRKDNSTELQGYINQLEPDQMPDPSPDKAPLRSQEPSGCDIENERHLQKAEKKDSDIKEPRAHVQETVQGAASPAKSSIPDLKDIKRICQTAHSFYPDQMGTWSDTIETSRALAPMIGVERPVLQDAENSMGPAQAAVTVLCMLERLTTIRNPGGYLRRLSQLAKDGKYDVGQGLLALTSGKLSADNPKYC